MENKGYEYCLKCVNEPTCPKYVKKQMKEWLAICDGKDDTHFVSHRKMKQLYAIMKVLRMPKGLRAGQSLYDCTTGYQWLFYIATLCTVRRDNPAKRKYETCVLEIARKNFKTCTIATISHTGFSLASRCTSSPGRGSGPGLDSINVNG